MKLSELYPFLSTEGGIIPLGGQQAGHLGGIIDMQQSFAKWRGEPVGIGHGAHERRADVRHVGVRWLAKLEAGGAGELCVIHNLSSDALIAEIFAPRSVGEHVRIELGDVQQLHGTVAWASETNVEIRFDEPIDVGELIQAHDETLQVAQPGPGGLEISCQGWLEFGGGTFMVEVCDLSQGGARVFAHVAPALGQHIVLAIEGLVPIAGEVRWQDDGKLGIAFDEPIPFDTLTGWFVARDAQIGSHGQSRRWPRYSILLTPAARLGDVAQPIETIVHNISRGGVLVTCRRGLHKGDRVELGLGPSGAVAGRVVWVGGGNAGIEFDRTIDAEHVLYPLGERGATPLLQHHVTGRRPGLKVH